ncbi:MAG: ribosome silencing factor [Clostridia bacterium]|nr:ribosome silencing factor [Clostridia bacterium]
MNDKLQTICSALDEKKAYDIKIIDVTETAVCDYFVVCSGNSAPQVKAIFENLEEKAEKKGYFCLRKEGMANAKWIVADYGDVIVHIFHAETRSTYQLDSLWNNGDNVTVYQSQPVESAEAKKLVKKQDTHCWLLPKKAKEFVADDVIEWPETRANIVLGDTIYIYVGSPKCEVCHKYKAQDGVLLLEKTVQAGCDKEELGFYPRTAQKLSQQLVDLLEKYFG